jgi:dTDP-4-dehydrorhamnose 3,5-epimerase
VFADSRGYFEEFWRETDAGPLGGVGFVQDNHSKSTQGVLRGMHFQLAHPQAKLVGVLEGSIFDVALDLRRGSPAFGKWFGVRIDGGAGVQMLVPGGVAHGFCVLSCCAHVVYKCSEYYDPADDRGVRWNDAGAAIGWPVVNPIISAKDASLPFLSDIEPSDLPVWDGSGR